MANDIEELDAGSREILTDKARASGVIDVTGEPQISSDLRTTGGDDEWQKALEVPFG